MTLNARRSFLCLMVVLFIAIGARGAEPVSLVKPDDRVLIFGDSISSGKGHGFFAIEMLNPEQLDLKLVWLDHGHPGWTAKLAASVIDKVLAEKPTLVVIMFGTNDLGYDGAKGISEIRERISALAEPLLKAGVRVVLLTRRTPAT